MGAKTFLNFDILIERAEGGFRARIMKSPVGEGTHTFAPPYSPQDLTSVLAYYGRTTSPVRRVQSVAELARAFGTKLFDAVFADQIKSSYQASGKFAATQNVGLRIRLRLNEVPELADAPWELLHDGTDFLALAPQRALVRYLELPQPILPLAVTPPLRALVVLSNPNDSVPLDLQREWEQLNDALADVVSTGLFELELLEQPTLTALQNKLRGNAYHILHFSGHGEFDTSASNSSQGALLFQDEYGNGQAVNALMLARHLAEHSTLRLVVLNACEGARASTRDAFTGAAQTLMRQNIPAVIAMQFEITDTAAQDFARTLYDEIANQAPIDAAVSAARKRLANDENLEWATPVLFTRVEDGNLFAREAMDANKVRELEYAALARMASNALALKKYERAIEYGQRLLQRDSQNENARKIVANAQIELQLAQLYAEGKKLYEAGQLAHSLEYLRRIQSQRLNYRDTDALVSLAERTLPKSPSVSVSKNDPLETHYAGIIKALINGRLVPFLGIGINLLDRPQNASWSPGQYPPSNQELATYLAENYHFPNAPAENLIGVSQYIAVMNDEATLKGELHSILDADFPPTRLHRFFATVTAQLREKGYKVPCPIIISTTYDDILERTFRAANEPFDLVTYIADGELRGNWYHRTHEDENILIDKPNQYANLKPDQRTVIVKIHGTIDRTDSTRDSFVITEDHYIEYLTSSDISSLIPVKLKERLQLSSFLFMGYALRDWNLRVLLYRIWGNALVRNKSWAIQARPEMMDSEIWRQRNVSLLDVDLGKYLDALETRVREYPRVGGVR